MSKTAEWFAQMEAALPAGYTIVPVEPTNEMICAALQASLDLMKEAGVDGLSPFTDYPAPGEVTKRCYRAMIAAVQQQTPLVHVGGDGEPHDGPHAECPRCGATIVGHVTAGQQSTPETKP